MAIINDIKTTFESSYFEKLQMKGADYVMCEDHYTLWLAFIGEIKTKPGEMLGVGLENYGCEIWRVLGENIDSLIEKEIEKYILDLQPKYPDIKDIALEEVFEHKKGFIQLTITLTTIFGKSTERVTIGGPC